MNKLKLFLLILIIGSYATYVHHSNASLARQVENLRGLYTTTLQSATDQIAQSGN